jgi:hypothetical protein
MTRSTHTCLYTFLCLLLALLTVSCGDVDGTQRPPSDNPVANITSLTPSSAFVGSAAQTLTINGTTFVAGSTVTYNGVAHTATFVSASRLTIQLSAGDQSAVGSFPVVVTNPAPGGGSSNTMNFAVMFPVPAITSLAPSSMLVGSAAQTLTINGTNFVAGSTVTYNGVAHTATFVSATKLTIQLTAGDQSAAGSFPVVVTNPAPGGGSSNSVNFTVTFPVPAITSLAPSSALVGSAAQTLTINGTNFVAGSTVTYNGVAHTATFLSATQLTIQLNAGDQSAAGSFPVVVTNPAPGGGSSNTVNFTVTFPVPAITSLVLSSALVGSAAQTLTINGTNFVAGSTVTYNGVAHTATFVGATQLTIQLSAGDQSAGGSFPVVVTNPAPGGGSSNTVNFTVAFPVPIITSLVPSSAFIGSAAQTLTINGTNFVAGSTLTYNGVAHTATFVSASQLTIQLSAGDQSAAGSFPVVVTNPAPGGGSSNTVNFAVVFPAPTITSLVPSSAMVGSAAQTLTINGTNFVAGATVTYNGVAHTATFVNSTQLTITLSPADQATAGVFPVVVTNPDNKVTSALNFTVNNPVPAITSLAPPSTFPCTPVPTLTINGTNFLSTSTVTFNGNAKTPTFVSSTQLTIPLTTGDIVTPGSYNVVVTNPAPGGQPSGAVAFVVNVPVGPTLQGAGPLGATLKVFAVNPDGTNGALLCTSTTDAQTGAFSVTLNGALVAINAASATVVAVFGGSVRLVTTAGQISSLGAANGLPVTTNYPETSPDSALLDSVPLGGQSGIAIGMPSTFVDSLLQGNLAHGKQATVVAAHASATKVIDGLYGFSAGAVVELIASGTADGLKRELAEQGVLTEGLQLAPTKSPDDLRGALAADIADGSWDGMAFGTPVPFEAGNLPATAGTTDFLGSTVSWVNGPGKVVLPAGTIAPTPSIVQGVSACTCTPFGVGLNPGNTGAIAPLAFGGHQYLFIAGSSNGVVAVDISDPTAASPSIKVWSSVAATTFGGTGVSGVAAIVGNADHPQIFAFTGSDTKVAVLNAVTLVNGNPATDNPVEFHGQLSFKPASPAIALSGSSWQITGAFWDGCWKGCRLILATADGYTFFNPATDLLDESQVFLVNDAAETVTGNMGPDIIAGGINVASPTVGIDPIVLAGNLGGIQLVDFRANASFYIPFNAVLGFFPSFPAFPSNRFEDGDGNAMDPTYQVGLLTPEGVNSVVGLMNLNGITETTGITPDKNTFTPAGAAQVTLAQTSFAVEGSAINPDTHRALLMGPSSVITVGLIQNPATIPWKGLSDWSFYDVTNSPSLTGFVAPNIDIHGVTTITSLGMVKLGTLNVAYGYLLDGSRKLALQIDLNALLSLQRQGSTGDAAHEPTGDPTTATNATTGGIVITKITW